MKKNRNIFGKLNINKDHSRINKRSSFEQKQRDALANNLQDERKKYEKITGTINLENLSYLDRGGKKEKFYNPSTKKLTFDPDRGDTIPILLTDLEKLSIEQQKYILPQLAGMHAGYESLSGMSNEQFRDKILKSLHPSIRHLYLAEKIGKLRAEVENRGSPAFMDLARHNDYQHWRFLSSHFMELNNEGKEQVWEIFLNIFEKTGILPRKIWSHNIQTFINKKDDILSVALSLLYGDISKYSEEDLMGFIDQKQNGRQSYFRELSPKPFDFANAVGGRVGDMSQETAQKIIDKLKNIGKIPQDSTLEKLDPNHVQRDIHTGYKAAKNLGLTD